MTAIDTEDVLELLREVAAGLCETFWTTEPAVEPAQMAALFERVDGAAAARIRYGLAELYPAIGWRAGALDAALNTQGRAWDTGEYWLCDAIDGAVQFVRAIPNWAMSLTLMREGMPVFSAVYDAVHDEMFHASWRGGAFRNGVPMRVNARDHHRHGLVGSSQPPMVGQRPHAMAQAGQSLSAMLGDVMAVRSLGSTALQLAYVACGRFDGFWEFGEDGFNCIGPSLLVQEAGGVVTQADGARYALTSDSIAAAPPGAHAAMLRRLCDVTVA